MSTNVRKIELKLLMVFLTVIMVCSTFALISISENSKVYGVGETAQVTADLLNVRSGAGTGYSSIGSLSRGKTFTVTGSAKDKYGVKWYKLKYNSRTGYVSSKYVNIKQFTVTTVSNLKGTVKASDCLNVRKGPGTGYSKLGSMNKGKTFTITGKTKASDGGIWYRLTYNGMNGYVLSTYVKTSSSAPAVTAVSNLKGTVSASKGLNVRSGPGTGYSKLGILTNGKTFTITGKTTTGGTVWYRFTYSGRTAYVSSKYVKATSTVTSGSRFTVTSVSNLKGTVKASGGLNVRSGPGTSYSRLGILADGKVFTVTGKTKASDGVIWYQLTYSGKKAYVSSKYIKTSALGSSGYKSVTVKVGTVTANDGLNVRSGAGTGYSVLTVLDKGVSVSVTGSKKASNGKVWYSYKYSGSRVGYICSDYVKIKTVTSDSTFEKYMSSQGFPESYKTQLRILHATHPAWIFKAVKVGYKWSDALHDESKVGRNLVSPSAPKSYRSKAAGAYNSKTGVYAKFDTGWYSASSTVIAYYMDPRNFLNENGIYQFMTHRYDSSSQSSTTVKAVIRDSFMEGKNPGGGYSSYQSLINAAGKATGVNPNVLAAMIIQEQGWNGSSLCSGTYSGYRGYYNFFNIGAYATGSMNAIQRGLWYAKGSGVGATSYYRPWNTRYKSIKGGAKFYAEDYVNNRQDSYYTKKFNVKNGLAKVGLHQYMTNVAGAASEGGIVKRAYSSSSSYPVVFEIPVFNNMPSSACTLP